MSVYCTGGSAKEAAFFGALEAANPTFYAVLVGLLPLVKMFERSRWQFSLAVVALAVLLVFIVKPAIATGQGLVLRNLSSLAPHSGWCRQPYGMNVLVPAYVSFVEPALAALVCVAVSFCALGQSLSLKVAGGMLLVAALKQQVLAAPLYGAFSPDFWPAFASMMQFTLEAAALGVTMTLTWAISIRNQGD